MRIRAALARAHGAPLAVADLELDEPGAGEILVRMIASGVCGQDLAAIAGDVAMPLPFVPGCEGAGIVEKVGEGVDHVAPGAAVLLAPTATSEGRALAGLRLDGSTPLHDGDGPVNAFFHGQSSFATHVVCDVACAVAVGEDVPLELFAALGRETLLGAGLMLGALETGSARTVVVTGADAVGLGACMAAAAVGVATIVLADPREARRALALEVGATIAVPADGGLAAVVRSLDADGAAFALETSGAAAARAACEASLAEGGTCAIADQKAFDTLDTRAPIARLVTLYAEGRLPLERIVGYFPFERVDEALAALASDAVAKPVIRFSLGAFDALDRALREGAAAEAPGEEPEPADRPDRVEAPPVVA